MLSTADQLASVASLVVALIGLIIVMRGRRPLTTAQRLDRLADVVATQWRDEVEIRGIATPWTVVELPPSRRLVVVGPPGCGKTVAAVRLVRELLAGRAGGGPVAVLFSMHAWDTAVHPHRWMAAELARAYRMSFDVALDLVRARHIIPVLDGLDEHPDPRLALRALGRLYDSAGPDPMILTSRDEVTLPGATVVRMGPVLLPGWEMLTSPLLLGLAMSSEITPAELAGLTGGEIEERLFDRFVPAMYADVPRPDGRRTRWKPARAEHWLRFLAGQFDLSWWELMHAAPRAVVVVLTGSTTGVGIGLCMWLLSGDLWKVVEAVAGFGGLGLLIVIFHRYPEPSGLRAGGLSTIAALAGFAFGFLLGVTTSLVAALATGVVSGLAAGLVARIGPGVQPRARTPLSILRADRTVTIVMCLVPAVTFGTFYLIRGAPLGTDYALDNFWPFFGTGALFATAWFRLWPARLWLALRGRTPLRLMAFLDDAHRRGVLRRIGPTYEFRHERLRVHLAGRHPGPVRHSGSRRVQERAQS